MPARSDPHAHPQRRSTPSRAARRGRLAATCLPRCGAPPAGRRANGGRTAVAGSRPAPPRSRPWSSGSISSRQKSGRSGRSLAAAQVVPAAAALPARPRRRRPRRPPPRTRTTKATTIPPRAAGRRRRRRSTGSPTSASSSATGRRRPARSAWASSICSSPRSSPTAGPCSARSSSAPTRTTASSSIRSVCSCSTSRPTRSRSPWAASTRRSATTTPPTITDRGSRRRHRARRSSAPGFIPYHNVGVSSRVRVPSGAAGLEAIAEFGNGLASTSRALEPTQSVVDEDNTRRSTSAWSRSRRPSPASRPAPRGIATACIRPASHHSTAHTSAAHVVYTGGGWELLNEIVVARHAPTPGRRASRTAGTAQSAYRFGSVRPYLRYQSVEGERADPDLRRPRPSLRPGRRRPHRLQPLRGPQAAAGRAHQSATDTTAHDGVVKLAFTF